MPRKKIIAIIDDDDQVRRSIQMLFRDSNYETQTFASAVEFLDGCEEAVPDIAIVDLLMPKMNGLELNRELVQRGIDLPLILMTGNADDPLAQLAVDEFSGILEKPFRFNELLGHIEQGLAAEGKILQSPE